MGGGAAAAAAAAGLNLSQLDRRALMASAALFTSGQGGAAGGAAGSLVANSRDNRALDQKALKVTDRIRKKLTGRDFGEDMCLTEKSQVQRLIKEATSSENLCQLYAGWCPYW
mmetsp:Transcript_3834/g.7167  ORF Transcript_3834/g.7167 Transcript_3834/m.7167 type:complete len:113 (+) Transcript_3834:3-341(+)